jgi:hypothetical protein
MTKFKLPPVGTMFILDLPSKKWGDIHSEKEVVSCRVKSNDGFNIEYEVLEVLEILDPAPFYKPSTGGGISAFGWDHFMRTDKIHLIEEGSVADYQS